MRKKTVTLLILLFTFLFHSHVCEVLFAQDADETLYGDGSDGTIVVTSGATVNIIALYENDSVPGVITWRGTGRGLNHGPGTYNPRQGNWINAYQFLIEPGATLTAPVLGMTGDFRRGVIAVRCLGNFINNGRIDLSGKGYAGSTSQRVNGYGPGGGRYARSARYGRGSPGGTAYTFSLKNCTHNYLIDNWKYLYGSGGAAGQDGLRSSGEGGSGGGGLVLYVYNIFDTSRGYISTDGQNGYGGDTTGHKHEGCSGGGGGGAGGTVYIYTNHIAKLGINKITAAEGAGGEDSGRGHSNPNHGGGGGGGANFFNGGRGGNQHDVHFSGAGGWGSIGRIHVSGNFSGSTSSPGLLELTEIR